MSDMTLAARNDIGSGADFSAKALKSLDSSVIKDFQLFRRGERRGFFANGRFDHRQKIAAQ